MSFVYCFLILDFGPSTLSGFGAMSLICNGYDYSPFLLRCLIENLAISRFGSSSTMNVVEQRSSFETSRSRYASAKMVLMAAFTALFGLARICSLQGPCNPGEPGQLLLVSTRPRDQADCCAEHNYQKCEEVQAYDDCLGFGSLDNTLHQEGQHQRGKSADDEKTEVSKHLSDVFFIVDFFFHELSSCGLRRNKKQSVQIANGEGTNCYRI